MNHNDHLVLVSGESSTGKSQSLFGLKNPEGVMYLNTESGKRLPFRDKFQKFTITDPMQVFEGFQHAETKPEVHTIVVDSATYLLDMYESVYVRTAVNTQKAWGDFQMFWKDLMQIEVAKSTKNVIFTAHTLSMLNESTGVMETKVPVKGALKNNGIESYFSSVISAKSVPIRQLEGFENDLLNITEDEQEDGFKYVFQTRKTKATVGERIRNPVDLFTKQETFIDNNIQLVLDRLHEYYGDSTTTSEAA